MALSGVFSGFDIASSGMSVQRTRLNLIASNIANADTLQTEDGGPYKKKVAELQETPINDFAEIFSDKLDLVRTKRKHFPENNLDKTFLKIGSGVKVNNILEVDEATKMVYDPTNPLADKNGYVAKPNINPIDEMVKMIEAQRLYEANATSFQTFKDMYKNSMNLV